MSKEYAVEVYTWLEYATLSLIMILILINIHNLLIPISIALVSFKLRNKQRRYYMFTLTSLFWISIITTALTTGIVAVMYLIPLLLVMYYVIQLNNKGKTIWSDSNEI